MTKTYTLPVREIDREIFELIEIGKKTVETRGGGPKYDHIKNGDIVVFKCGKDSFKRKIKNRETFKSIEDILKKHSVKDINPLISTEKELEEMYYSFPNYKERLKENGIIAFELEEV